MGGSGDGASGRTCCKGFEDSEFESQLLRSGIQVVDVLINVIQQCENLVNSCNPRDLGALF